MNWLEEVSNSSTQMQKNPVDVGRVLASKEDTLAPGMDTSRLKAPDKDLWIGEHLRPLITSFLREYYYKNKW